MTHDPSARVQLVAAPPALPGVCAICGVSQHDEGFADPNLSLEWHGAFYFCFTCVAEMAALWGFIVPEQAEHLASTLEDTHQQLTEMTSRVSRLESQVDDLSFERLVSRGFLNLDRIPSSDLPPVNENVESGEGVSEKPKRTPKKSVSKSGDDDSDAVKPAAVEGPDDTNEPTIDDTLKSIGL